jgi:hypothetical protein
VVRLLPPARLAPRPASRTSSPRSLHRAPTRTAGPSRLHGGRRHRPRRQGRYRKTRAALAGPRPPPSTASARRRRPTSPCHRPVRDRRLRGQRRQRQHQHHRRLPLVRRWGRHHDLPLGLLLVPGRHDEAPAGHPLRPRDGAASSPTASTTTPASPTTTRPMPLVHPRRLRYLGHRRPRRLASTSCPPA